MVTKSRSYYSPAITGISRPTHFHPFTPYTISGPFNSETITYNQHWRLSGGRWSGGGPMFLTRDTTSFTPAELGSAWPYPQDYLGYGTVRLYAPTSSIPSLGLPTHPSESSRRADGITAISRTEPTAPAFSLSEFVGELRAEGLPRLPGDAVRDRVRLAKASGSEYLNVEFGWLPLVRGIRDFARTVEQSDSILRSYQEHANRVHKRHYEWPTEETSRADACAFSCEPSNAGFFTNGGAHQHQFSRKWFEAEYTYYLPTGTEVNDKFRRYGSYARKLLGVELSPSVLWNLSPWSWAADWFGNMGDMMNVVSALGRDSLVIRNAYVMHHTGLVTTYTGDLNGLPSRRMTKVRIQETKTRIGALSPFGFGLGKADLTAKQWTILAALGMSRFG